MGEAMVDIVTSPEYASTKAMALEETLTLIIANLVSLWKLS